ncbi:unnamed protein product [Prorocentrum cordatum]|uniref:Protein kinase domain-containing protein n=1 Tax=Prorocentrum cordatum TaxID=2364126 RepID=A0ABN9U010_9DINO|nr:unnamed protein product [Polarella glacialis]
MLRGTAFVAAPAGWHNTPSAACATAALGAALNAHADAIEDVVATMTDIVARWASSSNLLKVGAGSRTSAILSLPPTSLRMEAQWPQSHRSRGRIDVRVLDHGHALRRAPMVLKVPVYLPSTLTESKAKAARDALIDFTRVLKANPHSGDAFSAAADRLSAAAYPLIKNIDRTSDVHSKPIPESTPQQVTKTIGKMISVGAGMDSASLHKTTDAIAFADIIKVMSVRSALADVIESTCPTGLSEARALPAAAAQVGAAAVSPVAVSPLSVPPMAVSPAAAPAALASSAAQEWEVEPSELRLTDLLGSGATAQVYRGSWHGTDVAVKKLLRGGSLSQEFHREVLSLLRLRASLAIRGPPNGAHDRARPAGFMRACEWPHNPLWGRARALRGWLGRHGEWGRQCRDVAARQLRSETDEKDEE